MKSSKILLSVLIVALFLVSCAKLQFPSKNVKIQPTTTSCSTPDGDKPAACQLNPSGTSTLVAIPTATPEPSLTQTDSQGSITVEITPENLNQVGDTLIFNVILDTHSIDLSMDLAPLTSLTTDTGIVIQASTWDATRGGHHVSGKLIFKTTDDGKYLLTDVKSFTITIKDLDVPSRQFSWQSNF
ncbi:MAG: hypothetical protein CVU42_11980 [Chloroflexi bacterium HGW-Chloroflexi-4]|jgi:hypothetical protein|nr:MAG: hypothetical protein CVU42_11980 [Chloroflexi bacterium HGW-Chloroflexi-4]